MNRPRLVLASASPRRKNLLTWAGLDFLIAPAQVEETALPGESPAAHVRRLARAKAGQVAGQYPRDWILAADTVVSVQNRILGKPADDREAERMLTSLSGRVHQVLTGFCLYHRPQNRQILQHVTTDVEFRDLSAEDIQNYLSSGEAWDKAGAYAIQGRGATLVHAVHGSYTNVIGLPLPEVLDALRVNRLIAPSPG